MYNAKGFKTLSKENPSLGTITFKNDSLPRPVEPLCLADRWPAGPLDCVGPPWTQGFPGPARTSRLGRLPATWMAEMEPPPRRVPPPLLPPPEQTRRGAPSELPCGLWPPPPRAALERRRLLRLVPPPRPGEPPLLLRGNATPGPTGAPTPSCRRRGQHGRTG